jgi:hypothetical protein
MPSFVIANGTSRLQFDLKKLKGTDITYGCNALFRDYPPDYIGCIDSPIFEELVNNRVYLHTKMISKHLYEGVLLKNPEARSYIKTFKDALGIDRNFDTGQTMLDYAARNIKGPGEIYMLGFDLSHYRDGKQAVHPLNNIYKGTSGYSGIDAKERFSGKWVTQMSTVFRENRIIQFYRVGGEIWPNEWNEHPNLKQISYEELDEYLANR